MEDNTRNLVTIQLTVPALEKLFDGADPSFILSMRQSAMEEFARRRIKALLTQSVELDIADAIAKEVGSVGKGYPVRATLKPAVQEAVKEAVNRGMKPAREEFAALVDSAVKAEIDDLRKVLEDRISRQMAAAIKAEIQAAVASKLKEATKLLGG